MNKKPNTLARRIVGGTSLSFMIVMIYVLNIYKPNITLPIFSRDNLITILFCFWIFTSTINKFQMVINIKSSMNKISVVICILFWISYLLWANTVEVSKNTETTVLNTIEAIGFMFFLFLMPSIDFIDTIT